MKLRIRLNKKQKLFIYGAGKYGNALIEIINDEYKIHSIIQTKTDHNSNLRGIPVISYNEFCEYKEEPVVVLFAINNKSLCKKIEKRISKSHSNCQFIDCINLITDHLYHHNRSYKDNINNRYGADYKTDQDQEYSLLRPIGERAYFFNFKIISWFLKELSKISNKPVSSLKILDVGCGNGSCLRIMAELRESSAGLYGFDYSDHRVQNGKKINSNINICHGDMVDDFPEYDFLFDGIIAFLSMMFLTNEDELIKSLQHIYSCLDLGGLFLWYEPNQRNHFDFGEADEKGYSVEEMDKYAFKVGFSRIYSYPVFYSYKFFQFR